MKCDKCTKGWTVYVNGMPIKGCPHTNCKEQKTALHNLKLGNKN